MTITATTVFRGSGVAAIIAGLIFVGVQINHPYLDAASITTYCDQQILAIVKEGGREGRRPVSYAWNH